MINKRESFILRILFCGRKYHTLCHTKFLNSNVKRFPFFFFFFFFFLVSNRTLTQGWDMLRSTLGHQTIQSQPNYFYHIFNNLIPRLVHLVTNLGEKIPYSTIGKFCILPQCLDGTFGYDECLDDFWCRFLPPFYIGD